MKQKMKRFLTLGMAVCMGIYALCACEKQQQVKPDKVHLGVACYNQSDTFIKELLVCLREEMEELGGDEIETALTIRDAAGSQRLQNDQVKELIDAGCNVLCVNLVDRADTSEVINIAKENDVPIIFLNREPVAEDLRQWDKLYYVGADARQSGILQGELALEEIRANAQVDRNRDGKIQYVVLEGEPGHQDSIIRTENAVDVLKSNGIVLEKLGSGIANWNRAQGENRMMQLVSQYQSKIELVLSNNDDMALGAIDAYKKLNYTEGAWPIFFGIDGTTDGLRGVLDSDLSGTVYNDKEGQAEVTAELALALVSGRGINKIEFERGKYVYVPYFKVTEENIGELLNE